MAGLYEDGVVAWIMTRLGWLMVVLTGVLFAALRYTGPRLRARDGREATKRRCRSNGRQLCELEQRKAAVAGMTVRAGLFAAGMVFGSLVLR